MYYRSPKHKKELVEKLNEEVRGYVQESTVNEGKVGDAMKSGWEKVKSGAKKMGKAIGDAFKGPFRKGDHIMMKGEDGDTYKGTIKSFDLGEKTYQVLLGNPVSESFDSEYDEEDEEWIDGVPDLGDAVYFQGCRIPKQDIYMELQDSGVDCYDDAEFDEYCKSNQEKVYGLLSDMCYAYPVSEDTQSELLEMGDRVDELDLEIDRLWRQLGDVDDKVLCKLILCCIEQEQLEPGRIVNSFKDYASFNEDSYDDRVDRGYKASVKKYQDERKKVKDRIRDIVGDEKADDVFAYWDRVRSSYNMAWRQDGFYGNCHEHLDRLADMLGPEGQDLIDDIQRKYDRSAKELSDYYATHDYTGD